MPKKKPIYSPHGGLAKHATLRIIHIPTGRDVTFDAYLDGFSDMYTSQWNAEDVYGRMDPIATFIGTRRSLSLAWKVPAASETEAGINLQKANLLFSYLYPLYEAESVGGATAINQAPLLRISFGNLIRNPVNGRGLLGYVNGFTFRLNCEFNILHEHSLGFQRASKDNKTFSFRDPKVNDANYPYLVADEAPRYPELTPGTQVQNPNPKAGKPAPNTGPQIDFQTGKLIPERNRAEREAHASRSAAVNRLQPTGAEDAAINSLLDSVKDD